MIPLIFSLVLAQASELLVIDGKAKPPLVSIPCKTVAGETVCDKEKASGTLIDEINARLAVAKAIIAIRESERDEQTAQAAFLEAQQRKARAAAALEAAKRGLPGWYEGALLTEEFRIAPKPDKK
jgi:hypothetical protein